MIGVLAYGQQPLSKAVKHVRHFQVQAYLVARKLIYNSANNFVYLPMLLCSNSLPVKSKQRAQHPCYYMMQGTLFRRALLTAAGCLEFVVIHIS